MLNEVSMNENKNQDCLKSLEYHICPDRLPHHIFFIYVTVFMSDTKAIICNMLILAMFSAML